MQENVHNLPGEENIESVDSSQFSALLEECYTGVNHALKRAEVLDDRWLAWFNKKALFASGLDKDPIHYIAHEMAEALPDVYNIQDQVLLLSTAINDMTSSGLHRVPFVAQMRVPHAFYQTHPRIFELAKALMCPISFVENSEVVGIATINPVAANIFKELLISEMMEESTFKPFVVIKLINYKGWQEMVEKHFGVDEEETMEESV